MKIGILDIQGSVEEHLKVLKKLGFSFTDGKKQAVLVKKNSDMEGLDGLIIPGGESTTIGKLMKRFGLNDEIIRRANDGMAVWGTCAGAILLAKKVVNLKDENDKKNKVDGLELMDITVERNAYGRQLDSFETQVEFDQCRNEICCDKKSKNAVKSCLVPAVFIRAPKILEVGKDVEVLAKYKGEIVAARQGKLMATTFHPEMTDSLEVHKYFVKMCEE